MDKGKPALPRKPNNSARSISVSRNAPIIPVKSTRIKKLIANYILDNSTNIENTSSLSSQMAKDGINSNCDLIDKICNKEIVQADFSRLALVGKDCVIFSDVDDYKIEVYSKDNPIDANVANVLAVNQSVVENSVSTGSLNEDVISHCEQDKAEIPKNYINVIKTCSPIAYLDCSDVLRDESLYNTNLMSKLNVNNNMPLIKRSVYHNLSNSVNDSTFLVRDFDQCSVIENKSKISVITQTGENDSNCESNKTKNIHDNDIQNNTDRSISVKPTPIPKPRTNVRYTPLNLTNLNTIIDSKLVDSNYTIFNTDHSIISKLPDDASQLVIYTNSFDKQGVVDIAVENANSLNKLNMSTLGVDINDTVDISSSSPSIKTTPPEVSNSNKDSLKAGVLSPLILQQGVNLNMLDEIFRTNSSGKRRKSLTNGLTKRESIFKSILRKPSLESSSEKLLKKSSLRASKVPSTPNSVFYRDISYSTVYKDIDEDPLHIESNNVSEVNISDQFGDALAVDSDCAPTLTNSLGNDVAHNQSTGQILSNSFNEKNIAKREKLNRCFSSEDLVRNREVISEHTKIGKQPIVKWQGHRDKSEKINSKFQSFINYVEIEGKLEEHEKNRVERGSIEDVVDQNKEVSSVVPKPRIKSNSKRPETGNVEKTSKSDDDSLSESYGHNKFTKGGIMNTHALLSINKSAITYSEAHETEVQSNSENSYQKARLAVSNILDEVHKRRSYDSTHSSYSDDSSSEEAYTTDDMHSVSTANHEKAHLVANEILETERKYVNTLFLLNYDLLSVIEQANIASSHEIVSMDAMRQIIKYLPSLQAINEDLMQDLTKRITNWSNNPMLSDIFIKKAPFLKLYADYFKEHNKLVQSLDDIRKKKKVPTATLR